MLQYQDQSQRAIATAHLAQTMSLLVLSNAELQEKVDAELADNPALELLEDRNCPSCGKPLANRNVCPACSLQHQDGEEPIVFLSPRDSYRQSDFSGSFDELNDLEPVAPEDLSLHVLQQLAADLEPAERKIAVYLLSSLDEHGYLQDPPAMIARANRIPLAMITRVVNLISHADPPGLATAGPREALLAQLDLFDQRLPTVELARRILENMFDELGKRDFEEIARKLDTRVQHVRKALVFIHDSLNPRPAQAFWGSGRQAQSADPNVYHTPDIQITRNASFQDGPLIVEIFTPVSGSLRVSPMFKRALATADEATSEEWSQHLERAALFVKCLQQRNNTMKRLLNILVTRQRNFILNGDRHLHPMTRAKIAEELKLHESTISRAVAHKSIALPDGRIIPLNRFFDRSLSLRDRVKEIIRTETRPYTDDEIASILQEEGIQVARRTIAKYRSMESILPARLRGKRQTTPVLKG
jgi:RNA polymerase sigma-54 factor